MELISLFVVFIKIGFTSFGGMSMVPIINQEMLSHGWMASEDVANILAIAEMTPGPLGLNCATFAGMQVAGVLGGIIAILGVLTPAFTTTMLVAVFYQKFKETYPEVTFDITLGAEAEATAKDVVLTDVEAAADVYAFADDQINDLVKAGALHEVAATYTYDVMEANVAGAIEAATVGDKLYAYPMTADNGCFLFYDASVFSQEDVMSMEKMIEVAGAAGKKIVFTPYAELYHYESKSRGLEDTPEKQFRFDKEVKRFQEKWAQQLEMGDPYYSPNLSVTEGDCSLRED